MTPRATGNCAFVAVRLTALCVVERFGDAVPVAEVPFVEARRNCGMPLGVAVVDKRGLDELCVSCPFGVEVTAIDRGVGSGVGLDSSINVVVGVSNTELGGCAVGSGPGVLGSAFAGVGGGEGDGAGDGVGSGVGTVAWVEAVGVLVARRISLERVRPADADADGNGVRVREAP